MSSLIAAFRRNGLVFLLLFFFCLYHSNFREHGGGDTQALKLVDFSLVDGDGLNVAPVLKRVFATTRFGNKNIPDTYLLDRPIFTALPVLPMYAWYRYYDGPETLWAANFLSKFTAVLYALMALSFLYGVARNLGATDRFALFAVFSFGISTHLWNTVSQGFWTATGFIPFFCAGLYFVTLPKKKNVDYWIASFLMGYAVACRQQDALVLAPFMAYLVLGEKRQGLKHLPAIVLPFAGLIALSFVMNRIQNGSFLGAYGANGVSAIEGVKRTGHAYGLGLHFIQGIPAILVSPSRGLFVFTPLALFPLFWAFSDRLRRSKLFNLGHLGQFREITLTQAALAGALLQILLVGSFSIWWGGYSYGPRLLAALLPNLFVLFILCFPRKIGQFQKLALVSAISWGIFVQCLGAYKFHHWLWNWQPVEIDYAPQRVWDLKDNQISRAWNDPWYKDAWETYSKDY